jgi:hypothetical protein
VGLVRPCAVMLCPAIFDLLLHLFVPDVDTTNVRRNFAYADASMGNVAGASNFVNVSIVLRVPEQAVLYTPAASEVLKSAWIQYISFFIIISFLLHRLTSFVFRNQLLHSYTTVDVMSNKSS